MLSQARFYLSSKFVSDNIPKTVTSGTRLHQTRMGIIEQASGELNQKRPKRRQERGTRPIMGEVKECD